MKELLETKKRRGETLPEKCGDLKIEIIQSNVSNVSF